MLAMSPTSATVIHFFIVSSSFFFSAHLYFSG